MIREFITNIWILGIIAIILLFSVACVWWYQYDTAPYIQEVVETKNKVRRWKAKQKVKAETQPEKTFQQVDAEVQPEQNTIHLQEHLVETDEAKEVEEEPAKIRYSPYGFGPYPELPPSFPKNYWDTRSRSKEAELLARVRVKLIKQGKNVVGASMQNGLVYPNIPGTIYVEWDYVGTDRYISRMTGAPSTLNSLGFVIGDLLTEIDIPEGIKVITYPDGGIDPYEFLGLKE